MKHQRILALVLALSSFPALAEDVYVQVPLTGLQFAEGALPTQFKWKGNAWEALEALQPYVALEGAGEAVIGGPGLQPWGNPEQSYANAQLLLRLPTTAPVAGRLFVPNQDLSTMLALKFKIDPAAAQPATRQDFYDARQQHYRRLRERDIPGGAWFRHQESEAAKARGTNAVDPARAQLNPRRPNWDAGYDSTYELFSGGRALSENLQLDRLLPPAGTNAALVSLTNLAGITVREMDWKALLREPKPALDPLAAHVPFDQHALFFVSFDALSRWLDEADRDGTPVLQMFEPRAEDANARGRYQQQLCLELNAFSRLVGPKLITSVAVTGSDPYLRTGSDVAMLYETTSPQLVLSFLQARQLAAQQANPAVKPVKSSFAGISYSGVASDDRAVSSYAAALENLVLVSNSRAQLERLIEVAQGKISALSSQDEYRFFRQRYARGDAAETGFLVLSDATIRRWCSPRWRIGNARRTLAAAQLSEFQAAHLDQLAAGRARLGCIATNVPDLGEVFLTPAGVRSSTYGALEFLTPIIELPLAQVTQAEADAYNRWRTGYQRNWSQFFDPIAIRFSLQPKQLKAEMTVMPLIAGTAYREFINASTGARIAPTAGDPHPEALAHLALAINPQSDTIKESGNLFGGFSSALKVNPLGWLGQCLAIYADDDPFWAELGKATDSSSFLEKNYPRLPLALYCEVKSPLGLTAFLAAVRAFAEQSAPQMTTWQNLDYNGQPYVKVVAAQPSTTEGSVTNLSIYYAATPNSLILTLSEPVLKRALDRQRVSATNPTNAAAPKPWLGTNLCLRVDQKFVPILDSLFRDGFRPAQQRLAWSNLPILNEWKRRYPNQDPVKLHEQFWQTRLVCPGGGQYVWNEQWQTMESTVYGHPAQPKPGPDSLLPVTGITSADLGLTFENQGLSARASLERK